MSVTAFDRTMQIASIREFSPKYQVAQSKTTEKVSRLSFSTSHVTINVSMHALYRLILNDRIHKTRVHGTEACLADRALQSYMTVVSKSI